MTAPFECGCITIHDCLNDGCTYQEPHRHGSACKSGCSTCHGQGVPVAKPYDHPKHAEWDQSRCTCLSAKLETCPIHHHPGDMMMSAKTPRPATADPDSTKEK